MKVGVSRLGHIALTVRDIDRTAAFYERNQGMRLTEKFEYAESKVGHGVAVAAGAFLRCDNTHHELSIFQMRKEVLPDDAPHAPRFGCGLDHIAFEMGSPADLLSLLEGTRNGGVEVVNCRRSGPGNQPRFYAPILTVTFWNSTGESTRSAGTARRGPVSRSKRSTCTSSTSTVMSSSASMMRRKPRGKLPTGVR